MFRKRTWRKTVSDAVSSHQHRALNTTIFILKEYGPIGFLLQEDGESKHYKVCLGDPHTCTCPTYQKEKDLCTHICWILMRKFRLPRDHEYCFQYGLVERQILELLQGLHVTKTTTNNDHGSSGATCPEPAEEDGGIKQKVVEKDDICPICQEELLLKKLPVTYCKFSCGNNIHISCMKVWADHQTKKDPRALLKCPLCREDFGTFKELIEQVKNASELVTCYERDCLDKHLGVLCNICRVCPIVGKCFKCTECSFFHLCEDCFKKTLHPKHCFMVRMKRGQQWQTVEAHASQETQKIENHITGSSSVSMSCDIVPNHVIKSLPVITVRKESRLLHPGVQCRLCLSRFQLGQCIRTLPCKHKFHTGCIDPLLRVSNCCPLEWHIIYNPLTWSPRSGRAGSLAPSSDVHSKRTDGQISEFFLPGIGLQVKIGKAPSLLRGVTSDPSVCRKSSSSSVDTVSQGFQDLCINSSHIEPYTRMPIVTHRQEQRPRRLSLEQAMSAPVERRASFPNRPSTVSMKGFNVQSAIGETQEQQQRLFVLALGACVHDIANVYAYSPGSGGHVGSNNPSLSMQKVKQSLYDFYGGTAVVGPVSKDEVKLSFETGNYRAQAGTSGTTMTNEKQGSESPTTSQQGFHVDSVASGSLVYGSVVNAASMGMSEYDSSQSTTVQGSEVISSSVLSPLQQSGYSVSKPVQVVSSIPLHISSVSAAKPSSQQLVQTISQSSSEQPTSSGTMAQSNPLQLFLSSGQPVSQTSIQSAVTSGRWPLKPLKGKHHHQTGSRPVHKAPISSKPSKASQPSSSILRYGSVPSSLAMASYELVSQSGSRQSAQPSGQTVNRPSIIQTPSVFDISVVQPSGQLIQQAADTSVAQVSSQQLLQGGQLVSQSSNVQPVDGRYVFVAQPGGQTPLKHHKGKPHFGSKPSRNGHVQTLRLTSVDESSSEKPVQTSFQSGPQFVQQPAHMVYQSASKPAVPQLVEAVYKAEAQSASQQPAQASYQLVAQLGVQQPAQVSSSVGHPSHLQAGQSSYEYVVNQNGQTLLKPVQSHEIHQIGSKLYSCHELPQHSYKRRHQSSSTHSLPNLALDIKPVLPSDPIPVDLDVHSPLTSFRPAPVSGHPSLQSVVLQSEQPGVLEVQPSGLSDAKPGPVNDALVSQPTGHPSGPLPQPNYQPPAKLWQDLYLPVVKPNKLEYSSFEAQVLPGQVSSVPVKFVSQPQMLPASLSITQSSSSPAVPVQTSYQPQVVSSYETVFQPVLKTSSVVVPSSSQTWSTPIVTNYKSVLQSVKPELPIPVQVNYQTVTDQNAPGPAGSNTHSSRKLLKLLQQVKS